MPIARTSAAQMERTREIIGISPQLRIGDCILKGFTPGRFRTQGKYSAVDKMRPLVALPSRAVLEFSPCGDRERG